jgi:hypothetical protein
MFSSRSDSLIELVSRRRQLRSAPDVTELILYRSQTQIL